jgi:hypothetical protein
MPRDGRHYLEEVYRTQVLGMDLDVPGFQEFNKGFPVTTDSSKPKDHATASCTFIGGDASYSGPCQKSRPSLNPGSPSLDDLTDSGLGLRLGNFEPKLNSATCP